MFRKQAEAIRSNSEYLEDRKKTRQQNTEFERKKKLYLLIGGRSGRISLHKDPATGQLIQVIDDESAPPALELAYEFLSDPQSSYAAKLWSWGLVIIVLVRFVQLPLLTLDGPHFYDDPKDATYTFLPTAAGHEAFSTGLGIPLLLDSTIRIVFFMVTFADDRSEIYARLVKDKPFQILTALAVAGTIPIVVAYGYGTIFFESTSLSEISRIILRLLTVCIIVHIYRHVRHHSLIKVVVRSISGAAAHLVLPLMTFLMFNITFGVIFYFFEPCFSQYECHWHDLLEATVFVVVTTTTTGFGNQYPQLHGMKVLGVVVMLFGSLYLSMPLALIGNEYVEVLKELQLEEEAERKEMNDKMAGLDALRNIYSMEIDDLLKLTASSVPLTAEEEAMQQIRKHHLIVMATKSQQLCNLLVEQAETHKQLTPNLIMLFAELKATLQPFHAYLKSLHYEIQTTWISAHKEMEERENLMKELDAKAELAVVKMQDISDSDYSDSSSDEYSSDDGKVEERKKNDIDSDSSSDDDVHDAGDMTGDIKAMLAHLEAEGGNEGLQDDPKVVDIHNRDMKSRKTSSILDRLNKMVRQTMKTIRSIEKKGMAKSYTDAWNAKVERLLQNEKLTERERLWMMFNLPRSSREATVLELFVTLCVIFSLAIFFMETSPYFSNYGETTIICGDVLRAYCSDKDFNNDPGCFVQAPNGLGATRTPLKFPESIYLHAEDLVIDSDCYSTFSSTSQYDSATGTFLIPGNYTYKAADTNGTMISLTKPLNECFGQGYNFGTKLLIGDPPDMSYSYKYAELVTDTDVTCLSTKKGELVYPEKLGFQTQETLDLHYGTIVEGVSRERLHRKYAICGRPECAGIPAGDNLRRFFAISEVFLASIFSLDLLIRAYVADTYSEIFIDKMMYTDFLALVPFYVTTIQQASLGTYVRRVLDIDYSIMSSSPKPYIVTFMGITKLLRGFKLARVFKASQVLVHTAKNVASQLFAMLGFFTLVLFCFSIFFYELERGKSCYIGDDGCSIPHKGAPNGLKDGDRIYIDKNGDYSKFKSVLDAFWFCFVSSTTVGYGDKVPVTNQGKVLNFVLMLFGAVYMVFPLTVASTTFYSAYSKYLLNRQKQDDEEDIEEMMKIKIFTSELYPNGFSDTVQQGIQFVLYKIKHLNMRMMELQIDVLADEFSPHHHDHLARREKRGSKEAERNGDKKDKDKASSKKPPGNSAPRRFYESKDQSSSSSSDSSSSSEDEGPSVEVMEEELGAHLAYLETEWTRKDKARKGRLESLLVDHSSFVARMYDVADSVRILFDENLASLETLAHFSFEADKFNTRMAKESLSKMKNAWKYGKQHHES